MVIGGFGAGSREGAGAESVRVLLEAAPPTFERSWWIRIHSSWV
jgi:hypothetical protein